MPPKKNPLDKAISKGVEVKSDKKKIEWTTIHIRIPIHIMEKIDKELEERLGLYRQSWILEAIQEKIKRDEDI